MVYGLVRVIVPELADTAVVLCCRATATDARVRDLLGTATEHTKHVLRLVARKDVIFGFVMAEATGVPALAGSTLHLDIAAVVFAAKVA